MADDPEFSVYQFFPDGSHEAVCRFVRGERAVRIFKMLCENVGARIGTTVRVIVTDGGDSTCMEWKFGEGYTWPPELAAITKGK